ncbi:hypothetical protein [Bombilactobacillus mellifer]|uniref:hypothetical protein n=1 Tax=Bombilactobacillus mellifer TaxID=1218492 RepID=UPI0006968259|nr:hypothetical protein [Bombilactobacillus mellifer]
MHKFKGFDRLNYYLALVFAGLIYPLINLLLALVLKRLIDAGVARDLSALKQASGGMFTSLYLFSAGSFWQ